MGWGVGGRVKEGNCLRGRSNCWMFMVFVFMILFCRIIFLIGGYGEPLISSPFYQGSLFILDKQGGEGKHREHMLIWLV
jgi:hypothetical protein